MDVNNYKIVPLNPIDAIYEPTNYRRGRRRIMSQDGNMPYELKKCPNKPTNILSIMEYAPDLQKRREIVKNTELILSAIALFGLVSVPFLAESLCLVVGKDRNYYTVTLKRLVEAGLVEQLESVRYGKNSTTVYALTRKGNSVSPYYQKTYKPIPATNARHKEAIAETTAAILLELESHPKKNNTNTTFVIERRIPQSYEDRSLNLSGKSYNSTTSIIPDALIQFTKENEDRHTNLFLELDRLREPVGDLVEKLSRYMKDGNFTLYASGDSYNAANTTIMFAIDKEGTAKNAFTPNITAGLLPNLVRTLQGTGMDNATTISECLEILEVNNLESAHILVNELVEFYGIRDDYPVLSMLTLHLSLLKAKEDSATLMSETVSCYKFTNSRRLSLVNAIADDMLLCRESGAELPEETAFLVTGLRCFFVPYQLTDFFVKQMLFTSELQAIYEKFVREHWQNLNALTFSEMQSLEGTAALGEYRIVFRNCFTEFGTEEKYIVEDLHDLGAWIRLLAFSLAPRKNYHFVLVYSIITMVEQFSTWINTKNTHYADMDFVLQFL